MTDTIYQSLVQTVEENDVPPGMDISECFFRETWGFTVYRTSYDSEGVSDRYWEAIVEDLRAQVQVVVNERTQGQPDAQAQEVLSLFRLDPRSNEQQLAGLTMQQMRELFLQDASSDQREARPMNAFRPRMIGDHVFLLVDDEVMAAAASGENQMLWVKCVDADYRAENAVPRNPRVSQIYFGWMKMTTRCVFELREAIELFNTLERIAPTMVDETGRDAEVYDGQNTIY